MLTSIENPQSEILYGWIRKATQLPIFLVSVHVLFVLMVFICDIDCPRTPGKEMDSISGQAKIKLVLLLSGGVVGAWGWWRFREVRQLLYSFPGNLFVLLGVWYIICIPFSMIPKVSFASAVTYWTVLLFSSVAITLLGGERCMKHVVLGMILFVIGSYVTYFVNRDITMMIEVMSSTNLVERFGGLGHPNTLGRIGVLIGLLLTAFVFMKKLDPRWLILVYPCVLGICIGCKSRSPVVAGMVAFLPLLIPYARDIRRMQILFASLVPVVILSILAFSVSDPDQLLGKLVGSLTKTGNAEELTTMTGRTEIWSFAWERSLEKPIFGNGAGSTPILMIDHSGYAHNILLQAIVSLGFPAGGLVAVIFAWNVYHIFQTKRPLLQVTMAFMLMVGLTESLIFSPLPEAMTSLWMIGSLWPIVDAQRERINKLATP